MTPHGEMTSSRYCLANPGKEYLIYLPEAGPVTVDLSSVTGKVKVEWLDPGTGKTAQATAVAGGRKAEFARPFKSEDAVLYLRLYTPESAC